MMQLHVKLGPSVLRVLVRLVTSAKGYLGLGLRLELGLGFAVGDVLRDRPHSCD